MFRCIDSKESEKCTATKKIDKLRFSFTWRWKPKIYQPIIIISNHLRQYNRSIDYRSIITIEVTPEFIGITLYNNRLSYFEIELAFLKLLIIFEVGCFCRLCNVTSYNTSKQDIFVISNINFQIQQIN